jgi:aminoglycoside 6-adenylyltransferase
MLARIVDWANADADVRGLAMVGSRAGPVAPDDLADIDLQVYVGSVARLAQSDDWLKSLGPIWVRVRDEYQDADARIPTRLVIFAGGVKVDFALYDAGALSRVVGGPWPVQVLVDKDGVAGSRESSLAPRVRGQETFSALVEEFWFEAYHVGKYLARDDPWPARSRFEATLARLLAVLEWRHEVVRGTAPPSDGKALRSWSDLPGERLSRLSPRPESQGSWDALFEALHLFRESAREVAAAAHLRYAEELDRNLSDFLLTLRERSDRSAAAGGG